MSLGSRDMYPLISMHIVYKLLVCIVPYSRMLTQLYTKITHVYRSVIFANFVVMLYFKFLYAIFCDIYRWLLLASRCCAFV